ncbi:tetratricopeptide repeat-containing sensor histidine kinase [Taibaiella koreensis]|uniref:tetratricopeptide repeat-containing sensor histidine kinase n=1 Tax=Taibaiella koreensis TaxID=1268548 RepID=UPI0013C3286A|nr:ATP-binding protein [Taibaiella koreensis]
MRARFTVLLALTCLAALAQQQDYPGKLDKALGPTAKMDVYVEWALSLEPDWDSAIVIAGEARQYTHRQNATTSELDAMALLYDFHYRKNDAAQADRIFNEALQLATDKRLPGSVLDLYYFAAGVHSRKKDFEKARAWYRKGYALARQLQRKDYQFQYFNDMGSLYSEAGDHLQAEHYYSDAVHYAKGQKDTFRTHVGLNNLAMVYKDRNDYKNATTYYLESLRLKELQHDEAHMIPTLGNLVHLYLTWNKPDLAGRYAGRAIALGRKLKSKPDLLIAIAVYCDYLEEIGHYGEIKPLALEGIVLSKQIKTVEGTTMYTGALRKSLGDAAFFGDRDHLTAGKYYVAALSDWEKEGYTRGQAIAYKALAQLSLAEKLPEPALRYLDSSKAINNRLQELELAGWIEKTYVDAYRQKGDAASALKHFRRYHALNDSLYRQEIHRQIAELETRYESSRKEQTIARMTQERLLGAQELKRSRQRQLLALSVAAIIALLLFISIRANIRVRRQRQLVALQNAELQELNQVKTRLFSIISHDLRSLVAPLQQAGKLMQYQMQKERYDKVTDTAFALQENATRLSYLLDNLLYWSTTQLKGYTLQPEPIDPSLELRELLSVFQATAAVKQIRLIEALPAGLTLVTDRGSFLLICRNLIANALKFTPKGGVVTISLHEQDRELLFRVRDTGPGMPARIAPDLDLIASEESAGESSREKGIGLGLALVRQFTKLNQGRIIMTSSPESGTTVNVHFPLHRATITHKE